MKSSFAKSADMYTPAPGQPLTPHRYAYTRTSTCRDWTHFDRPAVFRLTAKRIRPAAVLTIRRQAS